MTAFLKSDLFRHFTFGFALGAVALIALQPQESRAELTKQVQTAVTDISGKIT